jgi:DNA-binding winged helix-turn-helix (wHTH) protein
MVGDFRVGRWLVQPSLNNISFEGVNVHLEPKVMEVLVCLAQHAGETLPKEKLIETVWADRFVSDDVLKRCISQLRHALEDNAREPHVIQTIHKRGYRLVGPTTENIGSTQVSGVREESRSGTAAAARPRTIVTSGAASEALPIRWTPVRVYLPVIAVLCVVAAAAYSILTVSASRDLRGWIGMGGSNWILFVGALSFGLTPITVIAGIWSAFKDKVDRRIRASIAWLLVAQLATAVALLAKLILSGGRVPH